MFYLLVILLCSLAMLMAVLGLRGSGLGFQKDKQLHDQKIKRLVELYHQRLSQLEDELNKEYIEEADYRQFVNEQSRDLIHQVDLIESKKQLQASRPFWWGAVIVIPVLSLALYYKLGAYQDVLIAQEIAKLSQASDQQAYKNQLDAIKAQVEGRLEQRSDSIEYRLMLGQLALNDNDFSNAVKHYSVVAELLPEDAQAQAYYAQALYLANDRSLTMDVAQAMDQSLQLDPLQPTVLGMKGIIAFELADYDNAIEAWQKLLAVIEPGSARAQMIEKGLEEAKRLKGESSPDASSDSSFNASANSAEQLENSADDGGKQIAAVEVNVDLAADFKASVAVQLQTMAMQQNKTLTVEEALLEADQLTVFIFAKAAQGPPMPLAVNKLKLSQLPISVSLSDADAMMPQMTLSSFDQVVVGARLSFSGQPIAQKGDVTVISEVFELDSKVSDQTKYLLFTY